MFALSAMGLLTTLDLDELQSIDADGDEKSLVNIYNTNVDGWTIFLKILQNILWTQ